MSARPLVGVGAVVFNEKGEILLVKRIYPPQEGKWAIPGGHLELEETIFDGAKRELYEETGLIGDAKCIVNVDELIVLKEDKSVWRHYILIDVLFENVRGELKAGSDAGDAKFFSPSEAINSKDTSYSTINFLKKYINGDIICGLPVLNKYIEKIDRI
ncbi:NUDIX hydrolase [Fervidicoccus fontis]|uniref:ADP-ribose pyrophosphatase n=1 Tax=Fervidicoccus fontis (strain DSM 19380 / JCM 18336 / VKM B-2539 / Kam940) TaxID=1163730 RepID=I0A0G6_FERFK|nr:NUDIX hydrolase [Fervidicoccus fontis]AFH42473.1 ADP-ribose pyrophosphatase [Fervidicoccus fontis Kam940]